jgi:tetratricopeptide (TPR) repeat protein
MSLLPPEFPFLDVPTLLETSQPAPRWGGWRLAGAGLIGAAILAWYLISQSLGGTGGEPTIYALLTVTMGTLAAGWVFNGFVTAREFRVQQRQLDAMQELIQLRRWPEAAILVQDFLSRPTRTAGARGQAMLFLAMVLARYHRFEEAVSVYEHILDDLAMDDAASHSVKLGRAMALLRAENLLDADRAIAELRREMRSGAGGGELAALGLVEIYRDVKTGHPVEAIEMFDLRLPELRRYLGHRLGDAWALAARAYDLLQRNSEAQTAYENATVLLPLPELVRRYPEIAALKDKLTPAPAPAEVL